MLVGTGLIVGAANTLNMWLERDLDCLMARTKTRPLPRGRLMPRTALLWGALQGVLSVPVLALAGLVPACLGLVALLLYVGAYTPMKLRTHWSIWIGAVPGAMPALIGWTAATGRIDLGGLAVFAVLFFWQIPHTYAIGLFRQREYEAAGMKTLSSSHGITTTRRAIVGFLCVQVAVSLLPALLGIAGPAYFVSAVALGSVVLVQGTTGRTGKTTAKWAHHVFLTSIAYLPILFAVMVISGSA